MQSWEWMQRRAAHLMAALRDGEACTGKVPGLHGSSPNSVFLDLLLKVPTNWR